MTFPNESRLRSHQLRQAGMRDQGSSVQMPDFNGPADQANANRQVATVSTTQPAAYAQSQSTGTGIGGNMQPLSALPRSSDEGVENTWPDTKGNIPNPPDGYNPQLTRTEIASPEEVRAQEMLARYVGMIKEAGRQRQA
jgi:hypothetical protein